MPVENDGTQQESVNPLDTEDFAAYVAARTRTEEPEEKPSEATEVEETTEAPEPAPDSDPEEDQELTDDKPVKGRGLQRRFDKLTEKIRALEAEKAAREQPGVASPKPEADEDPEPKADDFEDYKELIKAQVRWEDRQKAKAEAALVAEKKAKEDAQRIGAEYSARVKELVKDPNYADFGVRVGAIAQQLPPAFRDAIMTDDNGPQVAYAIATDQDIAKRLQGMSLPQAIREVGRLSAKFDKSPEPPKPPVSKAPAPVKPVAPKSQPASETKPLEELDDFGEYEKRRTAQLRRK